MSVDGNGRHADARATAVATTAPAGSVGLVVRAAALAILAGLAGWFATVSLQQDFAAYYAAGTARALGLDPYLNPLGLGAGAAGAPVAAWDGVALFKHSRFLYPPLMAELFRPLAALPFFVAKLVFTALSLAALLVALRLTLTPERRVEGAGPALAPRGARATVWLVCLWAPVLLCLERGQIDLLVLAALAAAWRWRGRLGVAGGLLGIAILAKPLVSGVLPALLFARRFRLAGATVGALAGLMAVGVATGEWALTTEYARDVLPRAARFGEGGPASELLDEARLERVRDDLEAGLATIDGRTYAQQLGDLRRTSSLPRLVTADDEASSRPIALVAYAALMAVAAWLARRRPEEPSWLWGAVAASVLASPISWVMSLVLVMPAVALAWCGGARGSRILAALTFVVSAVGLLTPWGWLACGLGAVACAASGTLFAIPRAGARPPAVAGPQGSP